MSEYIVELDGKHSIALRLAFFEEMRGGDFIRGEIVRCRDCVFFAADVETVDERGEQIATGNLCEWTELWVEPNGFCSWAERRDA